MSKIDELIASDSDDPSTKEAKDACDSGELRGLWKRVKQRSHELNEGKRSLDELNEAVTAFFSWQRKSDRLAILENSDAAPVLELKWRLLDMLRKSDVFVLERGAIEQYYPDTVTGADKPSRAQSFCARVASRDEVLGCCGEQTVMRGGVKMKEKEFNLIFGSIFDGDKNPGSVNDRQ